MHGHRRAFSRVKRRGPGGLRRTAHHVTRPAPAQIKAPTMIVHGTPTACDRKPDSRPPTGIMPPNTSAQMPITRPRIALRHAALDERVGGREIEQHSPTAHRQAQEHQRIPTHNGQQRQHGREQPQPAENHQPWPHAAALSRHRQCPQKGPESVGTEQDAITAFADMQECLSRRQAAAPHTTSQRCPPRQRAAAECARGDGRPHT